MRSPQLHNVLQGHNTMNSQALSGIARLVVQQYQERCPGPYAYTVSGVIGALVDEGMRILIR